MDEIGKEEIERLIRGYNSDESFVFLEGHTLQRVFERLIDKRNVDIMDTEHVDSNNVKEQIEDIMRGNKTQFDDIIHILKGRIEK